MPEDELDTPTDAEAALREFLRKREADEVAAFEAFLRERPHLAPTLRELFYARRQRRPETTRPRATPAPDSVAMFRTPDGKIGPYTITRKLGEGAMGIVYLASQTEPLQRHVALKIVRQGMDTREFLSRFRHERDAMALMNHPRIAQVYDAGSTDDGRPYFAMEYVPGVPLNEFCDRHKLSLRERLQMLQQVCEGVRHAHEKGIIHRDLKPSNILVSSPGGQPFVKIIDFGVAKASADTLRGRTLHTQYGCIVGTLQYMSPEQAHPRGQEIDIRADVYSLGVVLYELLVGELPFDWEAMSKASLDEVLRRLENDEPPVPSVRWHRLHEDRTAELAALRRSTPSVHGRALRDDLDWVTLKAMARERHRRYASTGELAGELQRFLDHVPVQARPPSGWYRMEKFVRKNKAPVAVATTVVAALIIALTLALMLLESAVENADLIREKNRAAREAEAKARADFERVQRQTYLANITGAALYAESGNVSEARRRLAACPAKLRGWEWHHLWLTTDRSQHTLRAAADEIAPLKIGPDGRWLAAGSESGDLRLWSLTTGDLRATLTGASPVAVPLALTAGGENVVALDEEGVRVWDVARRRVVCSLPFSSHDSAVAAGPGGRRIAVASLGEVAVYRVPPGRELARFHATSGAVTGSESGSVTSLTFSAGGHHVAAGTSTGRILAWSVAAGARPTTYRGHAGAVTALRSGARGRRWISAGRDGTVRVWNRETGNEERTLTRNAPEIFDLVASPAADALTWIGAAAGGAGGAPLELWDYARGERLARIAALRSARSAAFTPDGRWLLVGADAPFIAVVSVAGGFLQTVLRGHDAPPQVAAGGSGRRFASTARDGAIKLWDLRAAAHRSRIAAHQGSAYAVALVPGTDTLLSGSSDTSVKRWNLKTGEMTKLWSGHRSDVLDVAVSRSGTHAVSGGWDGVRLHRLSASGRTSVLGARGRKVGSVAVSADAGQVAAGGWDGAVTVWTAASATMREVARHKETVRGVDLSPDGRWVASASDDGTVLLTPLDGSSGARMLSGHRGGVRCVAFDKRGRRLATGGTDRTVRLWTAETGEAGRVLRGHLGAVYAVTFSADGSRIVSGAGDATVRIWDAQAGDLLMTLRDPAGEAVIWSVAASEGGKRLAAGTSAGVVLIWDS